MTCRIRSVIFPLMKAHFGQSQFLQKMILKLASKSVLRRSVGLYETSAYFWDSVKYNGVVYSTAPLSVSFKSVEVPFVCWFSSSDAVSPKFYCFI